MSDDNSDRGNRSYEEYASDRMKNSSGHEWSGETIADAFPLFGPAKRAEALDHFDTETRTADTSDWRKYSDLVNLRNELSAMHQKLLKANR